MDIRTRSDDDFTEVLDTLKDAIRQDIRISVPVRVMTDSDGHTVHLRPLIKRTQAMPDGTRVSVSYPDFRDVPINHHGGGGITVTHAHKKDDEGIALMSHESFDNWFRTGNDQPTGDMRVNTPSDCIYIPGVRNDPRKLKGTSRNSTQTRTDDKQTTHDVSHTAVTSVRETSAHQVNGAAVQAERGQTRHIVDGSTIQNVAGKILLNCG